MKVIDKEVVPRYLVECDAEECAALKKAGHLPPDAKEPALLWVTSEELMALVERAYGESAGADFTKMLLEIRSRRA